MNKIDIKIENINREELRLIIMAIYEKSYQLRDTQEAERVHVLEKGLEYATLAPLGEKASRLAFIAAELKRIYNNYPDPKVTAAAAPVMSAEVPANDQPSTEPGEVGSLAATLDVLMRRMPYIYQANFFCYDCKESWGASCSGDLGLTQAFSRWNENHALHNYRVSIAHKPVTPPTKPNQPLKI